jgi:hypothetical protein
MADLSRFLHQQRVSPINEAARAVAAWNRINDKASSVVLYRGVTAQAAQTVRLEMDDTAKETGSAEPSGASVRELTVFGVKGHPTQADTSMMVGDRFTSGGVDYEIYEVLLTVGEKQGKARRYS